MLIIASQIVLLLATILLPLKSQKGKVNRKYKIDTDTSDALYAINEFGSLEPINRINISGHKPELEN